MAAENDGKVTFELEGNSYEFPDVLDLDIDEWVVVYEYSGLVLDDFAPKEDAEEEAERVQRLRHPGFMKAMAHIAYQRANPKKTKSTVKTLMGGVKLVPLLESVEGGPEEPGDDGDPPTPTSELPTSSERSSDDSNASLSLASPLSSETPAEPLVTTGTSG